MRTTHVIKTIAGETNVAKKYDTVMKELGDDQPNSSMLRSLSNARNCLAHTAGVVGTRHANAEGLLEVRWIGLQPRLNEGDKQTLLPPAIVEPIYVPGGGIIELIVAERVKRFELGQKIDLTPNELHEICFYYLRLADEVIAKFAGDLSARGIGPPLPASPGVA